MLDMTLKQQNNLRQQSEAAWQELAKAIAATVDDISEEPPERQLPLDRAGELTIIGSGIESVGFSLGDEELIKAADAVFYCVADPATVVWIKELRPDAYDLYVLYDDSKVRYTTYMQMSEAMLYYVRQGKKVVAIYYGHPGVFVLSTHRSIMIARREGHQAVMRAGVCALDCLCADLGVDPCHPGLQTHEATDMLIRGRKPDTSLHVVLWQVGLIGEMGYRRKGYINSHFSVLVNYLQTYYGDSYPVVNYVASRYPTIPPLIETYPLHRLHEPEIQLRITGISTLYLAPKDTVSADEDMLQRLGLLKPGEMVKNSSGPLREIGHYGPREKKAFKAFKSFKIPRDYHWQEDTGGSRFLIRLRRDLAFQALYKRDPVKAVSPAVFPGLTGREQSLLATRDAGAIQIAAKGIAQRSEQNQQFLLKLLTHRPLARSLQKMARHSKNSDADDALIPWASRQGYALDGDNMRNDIDLIQRNHLLSWTGVYFSEQGGQLFTLIGSAAGARSSGLFVNGGQVRHFSFVHGVLQWQVKGGNSKNGFLRFDVDRTGRRRLIGTTWPDGETMPADGAFIALELDPQRDHPSQRIGRYRQKTNDGEHVLQLAVGQTAERGRHLTAALDGQPLGGAIRLDGRILKVGDAGFELAGSGAGNDACWHAEAKALDLFSGSFHVRLAHKSNDRALKIEISHSDVLIDGHAITPICSAPATLSWSDGPANAPTGQVTLIMDPITLLPMLFGSVQTGDGVTQPCYGMVLPGANAQVGRPEPEFGLPLTAWQSLVGLCADASRTGGLLLWHKWEKAQYTAQIMNTTLRRMLR